VSRATPIHPGVIAPLLDLLPARAIAQRGAMCRSSASTRTPKLHFAQFVRCD
jgi:hypothetical protein